ncbi:MAG TPA: ATP-binding protein [Patescibacteria group bacterium]|nr:ATP-binding protein [Patescibacteria group bacterium]
MKSAIRKIANAGPKSPESEFEAILEIAENAFVVYDSVGGIRLTSERLGPLLQLSKREQSSLRDFHGFSQVLARRLANGQQPLRPPWLLWQPGNGACREQLEFGDGELIVERTARPVVGESGQVTGWVERYRDYTSERELPARLLQTDKLAVLGQMVAGITHELNNPLTTIMGYGHLLLERPLDEKSLTDVHRICQEAERAARIVRNLLMLAREAKLERSSVNLNEIVDRTLRLCSYDMRRAGIQVEAELDPHLPNTSANPVQLQQVVLNLLVNSQQAIAEAGRAGRIALRTRHGASHVFLQIEDNGPGIAPYLQSRIFEPFFTTKPVGVGTGLGLSIIAGILRQHGAEIHLTRTSGEGTMFTVSLPVAQLQSEASGDKTAGSRPAGGRILVVEAELGVGRLIVEALTEIGHQVDLVGEERDAIERVKQGQYDLIICDWKMRGPNGLELYRALGDSGGLRRERLLLISSDPTLRDSLEFLRESNLVCLAKPFLLIELKAAVAKMLAEQAAAEPGQSHPAVETV